MIREAVEGLLEAQKRESRDRIAQLNSKLKDIRKSRERLDIKTGFRKEEQENLAHFRSEKLRQRLQTFLSEDKHIDDRNKEILQDIANSQDQLKRIGEQSSKSAIALERAKQQYSDYVRACYPTWNKDRQVKNIHRVKKINNQINEIEKRRRDAEESFTQELEMREMLSKKKQEYYLAQQKERKEALLRNMQLDQIDMEETETLKVFSGMTNQATTNWSERQRDIIAKEINDRMKKMEEELRNEMKDIYIQPSKKARESDDDSLGTASALDSITPTPRSLDVEETPTTDKVLKKSRSSSSKSSSRRDKREKKERTPRSSRKSENTMDITMEDTPRESEKPTSSKKEINPFASIINEDSPSKSYLQEYWDKKLEGKTVTFSASQSKETPKSTPVPSIPSIPEPVKSKETPKSTPREKKRDDVILWSNEEQNDKVGSLRMDVTENAVVFTHEKPKTLDKSASKESVKESVKELKKESSSSSKSDSLSRSSSRRKREEAEASTTITKSSSRDRKEKSEKKEKKERRSSSRSDLTESKAETPRKTVDILEIMEEDSEPEVEIVFKKPEKPAKPEVVTYVETPKRIETKPKTVEPPKSTPKQESNKKGSYLFDSDTEDAEDLSVYQTPTSRYLEPATPTPQKDSKSEKKDFKRSSITLFNPTSEVKPMQMEEVEADTTVGTMEFTTPLSNFKKPASKPVTPKSGKLSTLPTFLGMSKSNLRVDDDEFDFDDDIEELPQTKTSTPVDDDEFEF